MAGGLLALGATIGASGLDGLINPALALCAEQEETL